MRTKKFIYGIVACALVLSFVTLKSKAADGRLSIGVEAALPMGTFGDEVSTGFGGSLRYEMPMGDNLGLMLTAGYLTFSGKDITFAGQTVAGPKINMIPFQVGAKYYFQEQQNGFYGAVELGMHSASSDAEGSTSSSNFSYAPEVGYHLANLDLGLRYQMVSGGTDATGASVTSSYLGLRIAYVLGGK